MVGTTRGLGWIGSNMAKVLHFDDYTTYNFKGPCKLNTRGIKNWRFSTNISLYLENGTRYGHSYNRRPLTADSFAVSCIGLGWVGLGHSGDGLGWFGSPKMDPRTSLS